ncbi:MAG: GGDEF domain-containing protein [Acidobacteria bacterium]|nr:GGDEF domain-containing protein [Acidobacteriota bacterium]
MTAFLVATLEPLDQGGISPDVAIVNPRVLTGATAVVIASLLLLLYVYRRRPFILYWIAAWLLFASSMFLTFPSFRDPHIAWMVFGLSQYLAIVGTLAFVVAADAYRHRPRLRRGYGLVMLPIAIWFSLAPVALGIPAVFAPGHVLIAGGLTAAGVAHLLLLRQVRLLGALIVGITLIALAGVNAWMAAGLDSPVDAGMKNALVTTTVVFLVAALGMQLMTFEDTTYELRRTNRRLENAQSDLRELVISDSLTGCRNRRFFDEIIGRELQRHIRYRTPMSLLFIDIDRFKAINDTLGHETGDRILRDVAGFLLRHIREADYVFRWGGDEFLALMTCTEEEALKRGTQLQADFSRSPQLADLPAGVGLSVGVVGVPADTGDVLPLIQTADERMYADKKGRR